MAFGRLQRRASPAPISEINVTPMVDVMLVLVVIFIITAPLLASSIRLELPQAPGTQPGEAPPYVTVVLDASGQLYLQDQPVDATGLARQLAAAARRNPDTEIQLRADRTVPYGRVVEVMGIANEAGLNRIGFVAQPVKN